MRTLQAIGGEAAVARFHPGPHAAHARLVLEVDLVAFSDAKQDEGRSYAVTQQVADRVRADLLEANAASKTPIPLLARDPRRDRDGRGRAERRQAADLSAAGMRCGSSCA